MVLYVDIPSFGSKLEAKAQQSASVCSKPVYIFRELMHYLSEQSIVAPGYSFMQETVGQALTYEQKRLTTIVGNHLTGNRQESSRIHAWR